MNTIVKKFDELTLHELYEMLRLRAEVFVVEQDCVYQDLDGKDYQAWHVMGYHENKLVAYTRVFAPGHYFEFAAIGRVVVNPDARRLNLGKEIMRFSIAAVSELFGASQAIQISAQTYLKKFYNNLGFESEGSEYLEDGIPHVKMIKSPTQEV